VFAQDAANKLAGTWSLVSLKAGSSEPYGANPRGAMFLAPDGNFSITILRESIPKFASGNRTTGTDAENKAVVQSSIGFYGTYAVNEQAGTVDMHTVAGTYPNSDGARQSRPFALSGDQLTLTAASPSGGGGPTVQVWKRMNAR
jgi:hypothetical protein